MDKLLLEQKVDLEELSALYSSHQKRSKISQSKKYLESRVEDLTEVLRRIRERDLKLRQATEEDKEQPYFTEKKYDAAKSLCQTMKADLDGKLKAFVPKTTQPGSSSGKDEDLDDKSEIALKLVQIQQNELEYLLEASAEINAATSRGYIRSHEMMMTTTWTQLRQAVQDAQLMGLEPKLNMNAIRARYLTVCGRLDDLIKIENTIVNNSGTQGVKFSIPKLSLPTFGGKITEWKSFIALFDRMIHNNGSIEEGLKIEYLKTCVKGDAAKLINHIDPTPENYQNCYDILTRRYNNKRVIVGQLLDNVLNIQKMKTESADQLKLMHDTVYECVMALETHKVTIDTILIHILLHKFDGATLVNYECQLSDARELQTLKEFLSYVENRFMALQSAKDKSGGVKSTNAPQANEPKRFGCQYCKADHPIYKCVDFEKKTPHERSEYARGQKWCLNCLRSGHSTDSCPSKATCKNCSKKHNTLLHFEKSAPQQKSKVASVGANTSTLSEAKNVILATAIVAVSSKSNEKIAMRALIDQGAQASFITENAMQTLRLKKSEVSINVSGIGEMKKSATHAVDLSISPRFMSDFKITTSAVVLKKLARFSTDFDIDKSEHLKNLLLADPSIKKNEQIDIILGAVEYAAMLKNGLIKGEKHQPIAQNTELGWIIFGNSGERRSEEAIVSNVVTLISNVDLSNQMKKFFSGEETMDKENETDEERFCEEHFQSTHTRNIDGRFVVKMPLKDGKLEPELGNSRNRAVATQMQLEKRFKRNPAMKCEYDAFIREYISLGHMIAVPHEWNKNCHFLPHHCVIKDSTTTKLRVVFDASQRTDNGKSLNEQLAMGKMDQSTILTVLTRLRLYKYAATADLEKMYRQILVHNDQTDLQRIVYRFDESDSLQEYKLNTITYGMASAPYIAIRVLKQLANENMAKYPIAANIILNNMYMDDVGFGAHTAEELMRTYDELQCVFESAGLNMRKACSNSAELIEYIPMQNREQKAINGNIKALGIGWTPKDDVFSFELSVPMNTRPTTKRMLMSEIASMYDPFGWIGPVIIKAKHLMQILWKGDMSWDDNVPNDVIDTWLNIKAELHLISALKIDRWIQYEAGSEIELHGFCDASEVGYAAVVYFRNVDKGTSSLLVSKTRVTPLKEEQKCGNVTIPRLELCGALLLSELMQQITEALQISVARTFLWTDSKIVLGWINGNPNRYKTFVANRITKICKLTNKESWLHVPSGDNPADCASRGLLPSQLVEHPIWFKGPKLMQDATEMVKKQNKYDTNTEVAVHTIGVESHGGIKLPQVSSYYKLKRSMAYVIRFISGRERSKGALLVAELREAETVIIKTIQRDTFQLEIDALAKDGILPKTSAVKKLSPFLDDKGILRVGGRLSNAEIPYNAKCPILLPRGNAVTQLIIRDTHLEAMHGGPRATEALLRQMYWVTNSQHEIKKIINKCVTCYSHKAKTMSQIMADLPKERVNLAEKPFTNVAVDYTGAIYYKIAKGRGQKSRKAYICIFVCMATRAIHIELVSDLTAEAYIGAFRRLIARRGMVKNISSDNGTYFVRANKDLRELLETQTEEFEGAILDEFTRVGTTWHFSPPAAPHFNGLAEAAVKSVKSLLKKCIGQVLYTYEEMCTLLCQVEACVNSRPLCLLSASPNDDGVLTPGHFLIGTTLLSPPDENFLETNANYLSRWQLVQKARQNICNQFKSRYLSQLQAKTKWHNINDQPKTGDVVLVQEGNLPSEEWPIGRIVDVHKGRDDFVRVVSVKMKNATFKRPITGIARLPIADNEPELCAHNASLKKKVSKKLNVIPFITAMLTVFAASISSGVTSALPTTGAIESPLNITRFESRPNIYFEQKYDALISTTEWNLVAFLNLHNLDEELNSIRAHRDYLSNICHSKFLPSSHNMGCKNVITQITHTIAELDESYNLFEKRAPKKRATLDIVGDVVGDIFGILGSRFAKEYANDMSKLMTNDEHLLKLIQNHTSVLESTLNVFKDNEKELKTQSEFFNELARQVNAQTHMTEADQNWNTAVMYLGQLISEAEETIARLYQVLWDSNQGDISHFILTPAQIQEQIDIISDAVGGRFLTPRGIDVYKQAHITSIRSGDQIIFHVKIPLFGVGRFKVYKIMPIPTFRGDFAISIETRHEYIMTSVDRSRFQYMMQTDINDCNIYDDHTITCEAPNLWFTAEVRDCVWDTLNVRTTRDCKLSIDTAEPTFIKLGEVNKWIFAIPNVSVRFAFLCHDTTSYDNLNGIGIMSLNENCTMKSDNFYFEPTINMFSNIREAIAPDNFGPIEFADTNHEPLRLNFTEHNIEQLYKALDNVRKESVLPANLDIHDIHHYTITYIILIVLVVAVLVYHRKIKQMRQTLWMSKPIPAPRSMAISMPDLNTNR